MAQSNLTRIKLQYGVVGEIASVDCFPSVWPDTKENVLDPTSNGSKRKTITSAAV
jgi:hypothetical protein